MKSDRSKAIKTSCIRIGRDLSKIICFQRSRKKMGEVLMQRSNLTHRMATMMLMAQQSLLRKMVTTRMRPRLLWRTSISAKGCKVYRWCDLTRPRAIRLINSKKKRAHKKTWNRNCRTLTTIRTKSLPIATSISTWVMLLSMQILTALNFQDW